MLLDNNEQRAKKNGDALEDPSIKDPNIFCSTGHKQTCRINVPQVNLVCEEQSFNAFVLRIFGIIVDSPVIRRTVLNVSKGSKFLKPP